MNHDKRPYNGGEATSISLTATSFCTPHPTLHVSTIYLPCTEEEGQAIAFELNDEEERDTFAGTSTLQSKIDKFEAIKSFAPFS